MTSLSDRREALAAALAAVKPRSHLAVELARELRAVTLQLLRQERRDRRKAAA